MSSFSSEFDFMRSSSGVQKAKKSKKYTYFLNVKGFAKTVFLGLVQSKEKISMWYLKLRLPMND